MLEILMRMGAPDLMAFKKKLNLKDITRSRIYNINLWANVEFTGNRNLC